METSVCSPSNLSQVHLGITGCVLVSGLKHTGAFHASFPMHLSQSAFPSLLGCILQSPFLPATPLHTVFFLFILMTQYRLLKTRKEITPNGTFFLFLRLFIYLLFLAMLGLGCCAGVSLVAVCGIIMVMASLGEHGL